MPAAACSLRQAIGAVNASPFPPDTITVPAGTYTLDPALGALQITATMSIVGAGAGVTVVAMPLPANRASSGDRVMDIHAAGGATPAVTIGGLAVTGGTAHGGNGFFGGNIRSSAIVTLQDMAITNGSGYSGGGVANVGGTMTIERSLVSGNHAPYGGGDSGGIQNYGTPAAGATPDQPGHLVVNNSTVSGNDARLAGGIFSWNDVSNTLAISNSTIAGNITRDEPGGPARPAAGGLGVGEGTELVQNSILVGNVVTAGGTTTPANCGPLASGGISSLGNNIDSGADCLLGADGDLSNTDPLLSPLQDNGGPTASLVPLAGSPALDRVAATGANCPAVDQRFVTRPQGPGCDIGAVEFSVVPPPGKAPGCTDCDGDLFPAAIDCNDRDPKVHPGALDKPGNKVDEDCSGADASFARLDSSIFYAYKFLRRFTILTALSVQPARADSTVRVRCRGRGCPFKTRVRKVRKNARKLDLARLVRGARLRPGARVEVRVTKPGTIGIIRRLTMRSKRRAPVKKDTCLVPGAKRPGACPL